MKNTATVQGSSYEGYHVRDIVEGLLWKGFHERVIVYE